MSGPQRRRIIWVDDETWAEAVSQAAERGVSASAYLRAAVLDRHVGKVIHARREPAAGPEAPPIPNTRDRVSGPPFVTEPGFGRSVAVPKPGKKAKS